MASDRHIRRSGEDYAHAMLAMLPTGQAWPEDDDSDLTNVVTGLCAIYGNVDARAADLLEQESDPTKTLEMLDDWERNWGLPESCFLEGHTIGERRDVLLLKMTLLGAQSREFFIYVASLLGYTITITEYAPFMCGVSEAGDTRDAQGDYHWEIGPEEIRFYWTVHVGLMSLTWFRASTGQAGVDPHLRLGIADDLECLLNRWKPAHTLIVFDYSGVMAGGAMAGTP